MTGITRRLPLELSALHVSDVAHELAALTVMVGLGSWPRLAFLLQPMRYDEAYSFTNYASQPIRSFISDYALPNNHLFHTLLVHLSFLAFGNHVWAIRLPALLAGIAMVPAAYLAGRAVYAGSAGLFAAALVAGSSVLVEYSTNARGYTLICLFSLLLVPISIQLPRDAWRRAAVLFILLATLGLFTIPVMLYPLAIIVLWLAALVLLEAPPGQRRGLLIRIVEVSLVALAVAAVLYLPVFLNDGPGAVFGNRFVLPLRLSVLPREAAKMALALARVWHQNLPMPIAFMLPAGLAVGLAYHRRVSRHRVPLLLPAGVCVVAIVLVQRVVGFDRTWLFLGTYYYVWAAAGLALAVSWAGERSGAHPGAATALVAMGLAGILGFITVTGQAIRLSPATGTLRDAEAITLFLKETLRPGDGLLIATPSDAPLRYYFDLHSVPMSYLRNWGSGERVFLVVNETFDQTLEDVVNRNNWPPVNLGTATVVRRWQSATLYEAKLFSSRDFVVH